MCTVNGRAIQCLRDREFQTKTGNERWNGSKRRALLLHFCSEERWKDKRISDPETNRMDERGSISIDRQLPKLDVAGSIPVSRSIFSITYDQPEIGVLHLYSIY